MYDTETLVHHPAYLSNSRWTEVSTDAETHRVVQFVTKIAETNYSSLFIILLTRSRPSSMTYDRIARETAVDTLSDI